MSSYDPSVLHELNRDDIQTPIVRKALTDAAFKKELKNDPRATISKLLGIQLPADIKISVLEESVDHFYVVLPPPLPPPSGELRDEDLEAIAAGASKKPTYEPPPQLCACFCSGTSSDPGSSLNCV